MVKRYTTSTHFEKYHDSYNHENTPTKNYKTRQIVNHTRIIVAELHIGGPTVPVVGGGGSYLQGSRATISLSMEFCHGFLDGLLYSRL